ncbi:uncharacterized protein [Arachis hypogaea]|uniref:uncharacterized protein n=1 Tax=Arachis hypogaea TaxID=3818 RepID=UPI003B217D1C
MAESDNRVVDALSRKFQFAAVLVVSTADWEGIEEEVQQDPKLQGIIQDLIQGREIVVGYEWRNGRLLYHGRLVISKHSKWIPKFLQQFHDSKIGGHSGFFRTYKRISGVLFWDGMKGTIMEYVKQY